VSVARLLPLVVNAHQILAVTAFYPNQTSSSRTYPSSVPPTSSQRGPDLSSFRDTTYLPPSNTPATPAQSFSRSPALPDESYVTAYYDSRPTGHGSGHSNRTIAHFIEFLISTDVTRRGQYVVLFRRSLRVTLDREKDLRLKERRLHSCLLELS